MPLKPGQPSSTDAAMVGRVRSTFRYPVKSMAGIAAESARLGWHGLEGDRRFAFRRASATGGMPWLTASALPDLILYHPIGEDGSTGESLPTHVRTPAGTTVALRSPELTALVGEQFGERVDLLQLNQGMFDEAVISLISLATVTAIAEEAGVDPDPRRFRPNLLIDTTGAGPFPEDGWIGRTLLFGEGDSRPAVSVTAPDPRCMMINLHPETAQQDARLLKTVVRINRNNAGVYATVIRTGRIGAGDAVYLTTVLDD